MSPPLVLLAEDDASVRLTFEFVLRQEGFEVVVARDGLEALDVARASAPQVILLDRMMPKMNGLEVFEELKRDEATASIPVIVISGMASSQEESWEGAEFLTKPFGPEELVTRVRSLVDISWR